MPRLKVHVKQHLCTAEAVCTGISPRFYELITNERGEHKALVRAPDGSLHEEFLLEVDDEAYDEIVEGAERCPPKAIFIWELDNRGRENPLVP